MLFMRSYLLILLFSFSTSVFAQQFQATYGGNGHDMGAEICLADDGGYVILGSTDGFGAGGRDIYLFKLNTIGGIVWTRTYGGPGNDEGKSLGKTIDGGFIVAGNKANAVTSKQECYLIKTDSNGFIVWSKTYGDSVCNFSVNKLICTSDGGFALTGYCDSAGVKKIFLLKTDSVGLTDWSRIYNGVNNSQAYDLKQTSDSGYILTGYTDETTFTYWLKLSVLKTDSAGTIQWTSTLGNSVNTLYGNSIVETNDGGYLVLGGIRSFVAVGGGPSIIKLDSTGTVEWEIPFGSFVTGAIKQTSDGGYLVAGYHQEPVYWGPWVTPYFYDNPKFIKFNVSGSTIWGWEYHGIDNPARVMSFCETSDGGFALLGTMDSVPIAQDIYLIKTDSVGSSGCNERSRLFYSGPTGPTLPTVAVSFSTATISINETPVIDSVGSGGVETMMCYLSIEEKMADLEQITAFPNPTSGRISFSKLKPESMIQLFDCVGQLVLQTIIKTETENFDLSNQKRGIYLYKVENSKGEVSTGKIILQ